MTIEQGLLKGSLASSKEKCAEWKQEEKKEVKENIEKVSKTLERVGEIFDKNKVEYYIGGGISVYLISGRELKREHSDIDIYIPQEEISKLKQALEENNFKFWDDRFAYRDMRPEDVNSKGELRIRRHPFGAHDPETGVPVDFFPYEIIKESFVSKDYYGKIGKDGKIVDVVLKTVVPGTEDMRPEKLFFSKKKHGFRNTELSTVSPEYIYLRKLKSIGPREKDIKDTELLKPYIDPTKLEKLKRLSKKVRDFEIIGDKVKEVTKEIRKV